LECSRQNVDQWIKTHEPLQSVVEEITEEEIDRYEAKVRELGIDNDNITAIMAFLNNKGRNRGWGRQNMDLQGRVDHHHTHEHHLVLEAMRDDLAREVERHAAALEKPRLAVIDGRSRGNGSNNS
jgi:hypothetical protein